MSKPAMGAKVMYCGHDGWFVADIFEIGDVNVVKANAPVTPANIIRFRSKEATHQLVDFPKAGAWMPERGVFVAPCSQVKEIK